jgi:hypothetical protein
MRLALEAVSLFAFPFGTAILLAVLGERLGGKTVSGVAAVGGLFLGIYFLQKALEIISVS